ncbi:hypothetical protein ACFQH6_09685 [Halobacteriaceae archaeon GCM10025711]
MLHTSHRGQTTIDFIVGMSVFLLTIGYVFSFIPGMFVPFDSGSGTNVVVADRSAAHLAEHALGDPGSPAVLNDTCTEAFFDTTTPDPPGCQFDEDASNLDEALGIDPRRSVNVTIRDDGSIHVLDGTRLAAGSSPPPDAEVVVARRVVLLDGDYYLLHVRVW